MWRRVSSNDDDDEEEVKERLKGEGRKEGTNRTLELASALAEGNCEWKLRTLIPVPDIRVSWIQVPDNHPPFTTNKY